MGTIRQTFCPQSGTAFFNSVLDEPPEFHRDVLGGMRQLLADGHFTISRASQSLNIPRTTYFGHDSLSVWYAAWAV
jgi:hypothetical protein